MRPRELSLLNLRDCISRAARAYAVGVHVKRTLTIVGAVVTFSAITGIAAFAWPTYHGQRLSHNRGVLTSFANGNKAGGLTIRLADGSSREFSTYPGTTFRHSRTSCFRLPTKATPCTSWPRFIVPNNTAVVVIYWNDVRWGSPGIPGPIRVAKDVSPA